MLAINRQKFSIIGLYYFPFCKGKFDIITKGREKKRLESEI